MTSSLDSTNKLQVYFDIEGEEIYNSFPDAIKNLPNFCYQSKNRFSRTRMLNSVRINTIENKLWISRPTYMKEAGIGRSTYNENIRYFKEHDLIETYKCDTGTCKTGRGLRLTEKALQLFSPAPIQTYILTEENSNMENQKTQATTTLDRDILIDFCLGQIPQELKDDIEPIQVEEFVDVRLRQGSNTIRSNFVVNIKECLKIKLAGISPTTWFQKLIEQSWKLLNSVRIITMHIVESSSEFLLETTRQIELIRANRKQDKKDNAYKNKIAKEKESIPAVNTSLPIVANKEQHVTTEEGNKWLAALKGKGDSIVELLDSNPISKAIVDGAKTKRIKSPNEHNPNIIIAGQACNIKSMGSIVSNMTNQLPHVAF